ncbi:YbdD/YjiX family protein [Solwaraspora sp. WMMD1047]|uniref:YbdD/YjiX family protein n=1 Tax=Solwaraspora sp. WMMD1047 TaxID=3016102 RepID=UPI002416B3C8|nr:YbdD/YjiX family protein [Solwaraspora sp. WMMD1047]MDG4832836.1 YbdD/YjiX family protein [Solwaraspora sp. WMMD1047]
MRLRSVLRHLRWYARELSGESAYDNYLDHRRRTHPGQPVLSRREFEALRHRPTVRCC